MMADRGSENGFFGLLLRTPSLRRWEIFTLLFAVNAVSACSGLVDVKVMNEGAFVFEGAKSLKARPDDGTWILRWDSVPVEGVSYEVFSREVPQADGVGLAAPRPYNFDSPAALTKEDFHISENHLLKDNTCYVVRLKYPGYTDNNTKELCTGHTAAVGVIVNAKPPVFASLNFVNAAIDKKLNAAERILDSAMLMLQATDFSSSKYAFVSGSSDLSACSALPSTNYTEGIPLAKDARLNPDGSYKVCVELANVAGSKVYGITTEALTVDTASPVSGSLPLPTFTSLDIVGAAADGYLNAIEKLADTIIATLTANNFSTAQYLTIASTADCSAQTYSSSALPRSNHVDFTDGSTQKICVKLSNAEGGVTFGASGNIVVDLNSPATPATAAILSGTVSDNKLNKAEATAATPTLLVSFTPSDGTASYAIANNLDGCASSVFSTSAPLSNDERLVHGSNKVVCVKVTDTAGNNSVAATSVIAIDTQEPMAPFIRVATLADNSINIAENPLGGFAVEVNGEPNANFTLSCTSNCTVVSGGTVVAGGSSTAGGLSAAGTATVQVKVSASGSFSFSSTLSDSFSNASAATVTTGTAVLTSPSLTSVVLSDVLVNSAEKASSVGVTLTGTAGASYVLSCSFNCTVASGASGTLTAGSATAQISLTASSDGSFRVSALVSDAAGNSSAASTADGTLDTTPPSVSISGPSVATISSSQTTVYTVTYTDAGSGITEGNITLSAANVTLNGTAAGDATGCTKTVSTSGTSRTISITGCSATSGSVTLTLAENTAADAAGNTAAAPATSAAFGVSNVAPNLSITSLATNAPISSTFDVQGACNAGLSVVASVTDGGTLASTTCTGSDTYSIALSLTGADGSRTIAVSTTNSVGQTVLKAVTVKKDATPPTVTISAPSVAQVKQSASVTHSVAFSDTNGVNAIDSSKITLSTTGGALCSRAISGAGTAGDPFIVTISNCSGDGTVGISVAAAAAADTAGNQTLLATSSSSVNVDNLAPTPTITSPAESTVFNNTAVDTALIGACEPERTVSLGGDVVAGQSTNCSAGGTYSFSSWTLTTGDGSKSVTVSQTDAAGNVGTSSARSFTLTIPPTAPTVTASNVTGLRGTLTGTCDSSATSHSATTTVGSVQSVTCTSGTLSVLVHLPAGSASFNVTATSTKNNINSSSSAVTFTRTAFTCPTGYVGVPGSGVAGLGNASATNSHTSWWLNTSTDFCVMKYPAKNNNSSTHATSTMTGTPWVDIPRGTDETTVGGALKACKDAGAGYRLMSNTHWQTVARNAESVATNWSGNAVGSGVMARGHTDGSPNNSLANDTDANPYFGTGNSGAAWNTLGATPAAGTEQKRTQTLSNGEVVWDFGGNVWQWVSDDYSALGLSGTISVGYDEFSNTTNFPTVSPGINRLLFAPSGLYTSAQNIGRMYGGSAGAVRRASEFDNGTTAGLFGANLGDSTSLPGGGIGFRCVSLPVVAPGAPTLTAANVTGLRSTLSGTCDPTATSHTATTTVGRVVGNVTCSAGGVLSVPVHLPAGSASFNVTATSTKNSINSSSSAVTFTRTPFNCPDGYVGVPASGVAGLGNASASANNSAANSDANWWLDVDRDFCVMKYPAKNNNSSTYATSTMTGTPWVSIPRGTDETTAGGALKACKDAGPGYRLISNTQWQTVARNAESVAANWSGNAVGSGKMARGHTDGSPNNSLANDTDANPYFGTGNSGAAWNTLGATPAAGTEQKRTQTLSNGDVVWDFGGNVWQWASDNHADLGLSPVITEGWHEFSNTTNFPTVSPAVNRLLFAPLGLYTSAQNIGKIHSGSAGAVRRGGTWNNDTVAGLFAAILFSSASNSDSDIGFRCVFLP